MTGFFNSLRGFNEAIHIGQRNVIGIDKIFSGPSKRLYGRIGLDPK